jgi:hypothetical protein
MASVQPSQARDPLVEAIVHSATVGGALDERRFLEAQAQVPHAQQPRLRRSPRLLQLLFGLEVAGAEVPYGFWDTTTVSMKRPLAELLRPGMRVLEIGPGPLATLSQFLESLDRGGAFLCVDLDREFARSSRRYARQRGSSLQVIRSDMVAAIAGRFDLVFMNPPYMPSVIMQRLGIDPTSPEQSAGDAGPDGCAVMRRFLAETPDVLASDGVAVLGINTRHVTDATITDLIQASALRLQRRFYPPALAQPRGPFSQVYVLRHR